ncbi:hypothetical protein QH494_19470 [Sphingomonas sp. AR_OL41]|uniref:hypothetical protein n=1 Tax=Sphingomonas sp. AR_OL41 TaxID=3042729 RepID=UPI00247FE094|nr:hypothetical protein [Sphingomonas sp. AR_OL41]MDH7974375.1 hypothetical protein [Sphingomonas sp. AR_OL41]
MPFTIRLFALWLAALGSPVFADTTANYVGPNAAITMKVEIASNGDVRGATSNPNSYFITRDGQGYMIQASFNGPAVMRVQDMATVMAEQMKKMMPNMPAGAGKDAPAFDLVKGGTVTIRGRQGTAYYMGKSANGALIGPPIVVISNDPALAPIGAAMQRQFDMSLAMMGHIFGAANPFKSMQEILKSGTPLVFTGMELDTVNNEPIPTSRFDLPAQPLTLDGVRKNMGAAAQ